MNTPWGELTVSDAHVHFFSRPFFAALAAQKAVTIDGLGGLLGWEMPPESPEELAARWTAELDRRNVLRAALIASLPGDEPSVATAVDRFPARFYGFFMLNPLAENAPGRLAAALATGRLRGICLFPAMHRYFAHEQRVRFVYELAAKHPRTVVFVHCGALSMGVRKKLGLPSAFDMRYSNPIDLHAIALEFANIHFLIPHFGAGYFREALMVCDLCPNICLDTSSSNSWMRYQSEQMDLNTVFRRALEVAGPARLLFGSDSSFFPRGWHAEIFEDQARALYELGIGREQAQMIFGGNLERLLAA